VKVSGRRKMRPLLLDVDSSNSTSTTKDELVVLSNLFASIGPTTLAESKVSTTVLEGTRSNQTLHLRLLGVLLTALLLVGALTSNNVLASVILVGKVEQLANLAGTLGTNTARDNLVSETRDLLFTLLHDNAVDNRKIVGDDATTDSTTTTYTIMLATTIADSAGLKKKTNTVINKNTLLHGETILIVTTSDTKNVALELITKRRCVNFVADTHFHERAKFLLIIKVEYLLTTSSGASDVDLHP